MTLNLMDIDDSAFKKLKVKPFNYNLIEKSN